MKGCDRMIISSYLWLIIQIRIIKKIENLNTELGFANLLLVKY